MAYPSVARLLGYAVALTLMACSAAYAQQDVADFYKGKTVTLVVSATPGGGDDFYGRTFAPFLSKYIPGNPNIIISNIPGAAGITAGNRLETTDPRDGTVIALLQRNDFYLSLISNQKIAFDPRLVIWIGSINKEIYTVAVTTGSNAKTAKDLFTTSVKMGATSFANENRTLPALMNKYYGTKFGIVAGFPGTDAATLAMERGEIQGRMIPVDSLMSYGSESQWLKQGKIKVLMQTAITPSPDFPDAPNIFDFTKDPEVIAVTKFFLLPMVAGRPFAVPPGVPPDRVAALRTAFMQAAADPAYLAAMKKIGTAPSPIPGDQVQSIVNQLFAASPDVLEKVKEITNPPK